MDGNNKLKFEWTLNFGHIISVGIAILAVFLLWQKTEQRIAIVEIWIDKHERFVESQIPILRQMEIAVGHLTTLAEYNERRLEALENK